MTITGFQCNNISNTSLIDYGEVGKSEDENSCLLEGPSGSFTSLYIANAVIDVMAYDKHYRA